MENDREQKQIRYAATAFLILLAGAGIAVASTSIIAVSAGDRITMINPDGTVAFESIEGLLPCLVRH